MCQCVGETHVSLPALCLHAVFFVQLLSSSSLMLDFKIQVVTKGLKLHLSCSIMVEVTWSMQSHVDVMRGT
jgi:hypothetical protein